MICIVITFRKTNGKNVLLHTAVAGTLGAAAGCLYRERLGERERTFYSNARKHVREKIPKMTKMTENTLKSPKMY
jgi:gas vesicle protein